MARQAGEYFITGTYDNVTFYEMDGQHYARMKSSLSGKRVIRDARFKRTMEHAMIFGKANKIASELYRQLPREEKGRIARYALISKCRSLLAEGFNCEAVKRLMQKRVEHLATGEKILEAVFVTFLSSVLRDNEDEQRMDVQKPLSSVSAG